MLKHIKNNFENEVIKSNKLTLVDFYATWCGPCQMLSPILEKIANENDSFDIAKVDVDENEKIAYEYKIMYVPTLLLFKEGKVLEKLDGFNEEHQILDKIKKYL